MKLYAYAVAAERAAKIARDMADHEAVIEDLRKQLAKATNQLDELRRIAERAIEAWDTTVLHAASDGIMQERMETLRSAIDSVKGRAV